ncbi:hypothetical protein G6O67_006162 [Ophiocordyceps sinensis]|uniref:Uncharacterized protein n=1 Tax=Ophiocordyceps sinensis TaxID=72228 RepID=A0A8H4LV72_9HYPO|nr:hypothetical protein G6O67_006162 [Ophiocordyceps sinensis]
MATLQTLVDGFARLERKVDTLQVKVNTLEGKVDTLQGDVNELKRSTTVINKNSEAKRWNQSATRPEDILAPMFRPNGELVNDCPGTVEELTGLNVVDVDRLLRELDVVAGDAQWRRNQLLLALGVTSILSRTWARTGVNPHTGPNVHLSRGTA